MNEEKTPAQRAEAALSDQRLFCQLLAEARTCRVAGWWEGSAFRNHPCGLIVGTIKMTDHWHVDNLGTIELTDGDGWDLNVCQDSRAYGDPHPKPINGSAVRAWRCGQWSSPEIEAAVRPRVLQILTTAAEVIQRTREIERIQVERTRQAAQDEERRRLEAALAKASA